MRNTLIWSFLSLLALSTAGLATGCDGDAKIAKSAEGESCTKTSDCEDGLRCKNDTCYKSGGGNNNAGGEGNGGVDGPPPPVLGGPGESCTKRADCADGLSCLNQRCQMESLGMGGAEAGPTLGGPGETCGLSSDCAAGLACLPSDSTPQLETRSFGTNSIGVCAPVSNGLVPTGKDCGSECRTNADCCELPFELHVAVAAESCSELASLLDGKKCETAVAGSLLAAQCFAQSAYCECGKTTWTCEAGRCNYTAACSKPGFNAPDACPTFTRAGHSLVAACDVKGSKKCQAPAAEAACKTDASCETQPVTGVRPAAVCGVDECTCYKPTGLCYRKCGEDLDCPVNYSCNVKTAVCEREPGCTSDQQCITRLNSIRAKCFDGGVCDVVCDNDRDCNSGALTQGAATQVCNADKRCEAAGCGDDRDCPGTANGLRLFCTERPASPGEVTTVTSAITD